MIDIPTGIAIGIAFIAVIFAGYSAHISKKTMRHQALLDVKKDYRSPEIMVALYILWNLYKEECNEDENKLVKKYTNQVNNEKKIINKEKKDFNKKKELIENSLSNQRRLVVTFYFHLYDLYKHKILSEDMIFGYWRKDTLEIIPKILAHLVMAQAKIDKVDEEITQKQLDKLKELYDKAEAYSNRNECN